MSKAIQGAAMIVGGIVLMATGVGAGFGAMLLLGGISMEAGAISNALTSQRGMGITTRLAAGLRQIVYGMQRIGGVVIYQSTTGACGNTGHYVYNYVIVLAAHEIDAIVNLYLDGRVVYWSQFEEGCYGSYRGNIGCGSVSNPPVCSATVVDGVITAITATGGSGFATVHPHKGYRVVIRDATGSGAQAWADNSTAGHRGTVYAPVGTWTVNVESGGSGYTDPQIEIQGAYVFGGVAAADCQDPTDAAYGHGYSIGPGGAHYNMAGKVYCEVRFGDQPPGDTMASLTMTDPAWSGSSATISATATGTVVMGGLPGALTVKSVHITNRGNYPGGVPPTVSFSSGTATGIVYMIGNQVGSVQITDGGSYTSPPTISFSDSTAENANATPQVAGCAYIYLNVGYDTALFPNAPEIKVTVRGKNDIYDPRTGNRGYSENWALQVADVITDSVWGLGDDTVNQNQLIAAANVCDELVQTSQGPEKRYAQHIHYDTSAAPGDVLSMMMPSAGGRLSRIGGEWYIWPAYWQGPSFSLDESSLMDTIQWEPYRSFRDLVNRVSGTYTAPNSPYNIAGNLYDKNGWWFGETANLWPLAWQTTSYPSYACDVLHGYLEDVYLTQDSGVQLPMNLPLPGVISIVQAQRLAKIALLRNRFQGSGTMEMNLAAWRMQPLDVLEFTFPAMGWGTTYTSLIGSDPIPLPDDIVVPGGAQVAWALPTSVESYNGAGASGIGTAASWTPSLDNKIPTVTNATSTLYKWFGGGLATPYGPAVIWGSPRLLTPMPPSAVIHGIYPVIHGQYTAVVGEEAIQFNTQGTGLVFPSNGILGGGMPDLPTSPAAISGYSIGTSLSLLTANQNIAVNIAASLLGAYNSVQEVYAVGWAIVYSSTTVTPTFVVGKALEVDKITLKAAPVQSDSGEEGAVALTCTVNVIETDPSIYEWDITEELTPYDVPAQPGAVSDIVPPPTDLTLTDESTGSITSAGVSVANIMCNWVAPDDIYVTTNGTIRLQAQYYIGSVEQGWLDVAILSGSATSYSLTTSINGAYTNIAVRICSVRPDGNTSVWVQDSESLDVYGTPHPIGHPPTGIGSTFLVNGA